MSSALEEVVLHLLSEEGERVRFPGPIVPTPTPTATFKTTGSYNTSCRLPGEHPLR